jgi:hypothetical protein
MKASAQIIQLPTAAPASVPIAVLRGRYPKNVVPNRSLHNLRVRRKLQSDNAMVFAKELAQIAIHEDCAAELQEQLSWSVFQLADRERQSLKRRLDAHREYIAVHRAKIKSHTDFME